MIAPATGAGSTTITEADVAIDLARVLDRAAAGEEIVITRGGERVARILPADPRRSPEAIAALMVRLEENREYLRSRGIHITTEELIASKNEGRR